MMSISTHDIAVVTETVWESMLGLVPTVCAEDAVALHGRTFDGVIHIVGDWNGAVVLQFSEALARRATAAMFKLDDHEPSQEDIQDAVGELTNMTGGNLKALMPGTCQLSLPAVVQGRDYAVRVPSATLVNKVVFDCGGDAVVVNIVAGDARRAA